MSLRSANNSQHLTITAPGVAALPSSPFTVAMLFKNNAFSSTSLWQGYEPSNFSQVNMYYSAGDLYFAGGGFVDSNLSNDTAIWRWLVATKDAVDEPPRVHYADYAETGSLSWTHTNFSVSRSSVYGNLNRFSIGDEFGGGFSGDLACLVAFTEEFNDADVASTFLRSSADILSAGPGFFVHWPESAGISSPFASLVGGGVETIRSGTWSASADPPGFNFSLGRSGKPKTWGGSSWNQHNAKVWNGSSWVSHKMSGHNGSDFIIAK